MFRNTALGFGHDGVHMGVLQDKVSLRHEMGVLQLGTWRKECVHCDLVLWVFRSSIEVFRPVFDHVAAKRDLKQLKHHIASGCPDAHARGFV